MHSNSDRSVRFLFDVVSPTSYFAWAQLARIRAATGAEIHFEPVLLGGIFKASGNSSPIANPAKAAWMLTDLDLWARRHGVDFTLNPHFPLNSVRLQRAATAALDRNEIETFLACVFPAMWRDGRNLGDAAVVDAVLTEAGLDAAAYAVLVEDEAVKERLKARTQAAVEQGVFGVPSFFVGKRLFFGQDRLEFVIDALLGHH